MPEQVAGFLSGVMPHAKSQETLAMKPGIEMNTAAEAVEAVIAHHDQQSLTIGCLEHLANDGVAMTVAVLDHPSELVVRGSSPMGGVIGLSNRQNMCCMRSGVSNKT